MYRCKNHEECLIYEQSYFYSILLVTARFSRSDVIPELVPNCTVYTVRDVIPEIVPNCTVYNVRDVNPEKVPNCSVHCT